MGRCWNLRLLFASRQRFIKHTVIQPRLELCKQSSSQRWAGEAVISLHVVQALRRGREGLKGQRDD